MPFPVEPPAPVLRQFVGFGRCLRENGIAVNPANMVDLCRAMQYIDLAVRADVKSAARATLVNKHGDLQMFERLFDQYWMPAGAKSALEDNEAGESEPQPSWLPPAPAPAPEELLLAGESRGAEPGQARPQESIGYSDQEVLSHKDLGSLDEDEINLARSLIADLVKVLSNKPGRRYQTAARSRVLDFRRSFRSNLRQGFSGLELKYRKPKIKKLKLMLLCDVSGSMQRYSQFLLDFIYALQHQLPRIEAAVFATHITPITPYLKQRDVQRSLAEVAAQARGWGGGTDIGQALAEFNQRYARDLLHSKTVMVILSDGWDRGDARMMRREIIALRRRVDQLIWLNPLLGSAGYQPLCRGIETALPYLDHFLPAHNLRSLASVVEMLKSSTGSGL